MTILYEKVGRRYKPVMTDDWYHQTRLADMAKPGHILVCITGNCTSYQHSVNPDHAVVLAALRDCREAMFAAMHKAAEFKPKTTKLSEAHQMAYAKYQAAIPKEEREALWAGSIQDGLDAAEKCLMSWIYPKK
jgi:hypothetical protein